MSAPRTNKEIAERDARILAGLCGVMEDEALRRQYENAVSRAEDHHKEGTLNPGGLARDFRRVADRTSVVVASQFLLSTKHAWTQSVRRRCGDILAATVMQSLNNNSAASANGEKSEKQETISRN